MSGDNLQQYVDKDGGRWEWRQYPEGGHSFTDPAGSFFAEWYVLERFGPLTSASVHAEVARLRQELFDSRSLCDGHVDSRDLDEARAHHATLEELRLLGEQKLAKVQAERDALRRELDIGDDDPRTTKWYRDHMALAEKVHEMAAQHTELTRERGDALAEVVRLHQELDDQDEVLGGVIDRIEAANTLLRAERDTLATRLAQVEAERDAMRAVVEAASALLEAQVATMSADDGWPNGLWHDLAVAIGECPWRAAAYQATGTTTGEQQQTTT